MNNYEQHIKKNLLLSPTSPFCSFEIFSWVAPKKSPTVASHLRFQELTLLLKSSANTQRSVWFYLVLLGGSFSHFARRSGKAMVEELKSGYSEHPRTFHSSTLPNLWRILTTSSKALCWRISAFSRFLAVSCRSKTWHLGFKQNSLLIRLVSYIYIEWVCF